MVVANGSSFALLFQQHISKTARKTLLKKLLSPSVDACGMGAFDQCHWPVQDAFWPGVAVVYHSPKFRSRCCGKNKLTMKNNHGKKTLAAFDANQITPSQQLKVKGGDGGETGGALPIIGIDDIING